MDCPTIQNGYMDKHFDKMYTDKHTVNVIPSSKMSVGKNVCKQND